MLHIIIGKIIILNLSVNLMKSGLLSISILSQLKDVINQLGETAYSETLDVFSGASIGQHTRHILEFYLCLLQQKNKGDICYDKRERNLALETDIQVTTATINLLIDNLKLVTEDTPVTLSCELQGESIITPSSVSRELLYALEHAVHHMAIIKIGLLLNCPTLTIPQNFGVADSTVQYRNQCAQ